MMGVATSLSCTLVGFFHNQKSGYCVLCKYHLENENWIFSPKFTFGLGFERKDSFTLNKTPSLSRIFHGSESLAY